MKKFLPLIVLLLPFFCLSQQIRFVNKVSGEILVGLKISADSSHLSTSTDNFGTANLTPFKGFNAILLEIPGEFPILFSYDQITRSNVFEFEFTPNLKEVTVAANRWSQAKMEIPHKIRTIDKGDIDFGNAQTTADLLAQSGEVFIQKSQQGGGSPMIRGFATNRLLYSIDGVRMNTAIFRAGNIQNVISLDALAMENVEILFGPGTVLYGSDAIGGVMAFETFDAKMSTESGKKISANVFSRYASANQEKTLHLDLNIGFQKIAFLTSLTHSDFSDLKMGSHGPDEYLRPFYVHRPDSVDVVQANRNSKIQKPSEYSQLNLMQKIKFSPAQDFDLSYAFHFSKTSSYSRYDRLIETREDGLPQSAVWNYGPQKWMMNHLEFHSRKKSAIYDQFSVRLAHQEFEESRIDRNFNGAQRFRLRKQTEKVSAYSLNADFEKPLNLHHLSYGLEGIYNKVASRAAAQNIQTLEAILVPNRYPESTWATAAAYVNYKHKFNASFTGQTGLRYSFYKLTADFTDHLSFFPFDFTQSELQNHALTGNIGAALTKKSWHLAVNFSTGYRAPNVDDVGKIFDFSAGEVVVPNTRLRAEYVYSGEITVAKSIGNRVKLECTAYLSRLENAMVRREFRVNGADSIVYNGSMSKVYAIQNSAFAQIAGFHINVDIALPLNLKFCSRYNFQRGTEEMDDGTRSPARHAAPAFGFTAVSYSKSGWDLSLYSNYSAQVRAKNLNEEEKTKPALYAIDSSGKLYSPSWHTFNFKMLKKLGRNYAFGFAVENFTDRRYRPYSSGLVAPGINLMISLDARF